MSLDPCLKRTYEDRDEYRAAVIRHLGYFNTNPYLAGIVLGAVAKLEERRARLSVEERKGFDKKIDQMKMSLSAAMAAIGDSFFWGALKPACAASAILLWLFLWTLRVPHPFFWGGLFYLVAFNAPALFVRWRGIRLGYAHPDDIATELQGLRLPAKALWVRRAGLASAVLLFLASLIVPPWGGAMSMTGVFVFGAALALRRAGVTCAKTYAAAVGLGCAGALAGL